MGLTFFMEEVKAQNALESETATALLVASSWKADSVDAIAEAVDIIGGLYEESNNSIVAEAATWLLKQQNEDGLFYSPGARRPADTSYNHLHPSWATVAGLQF